MGGGAHQRGVEQTAEPLPQREEAEHAAGVDEAHAVPELPRIAPELVEQRGERLPRVHRIDHQTFLPRDVHHGGELLVADLAAAHALIAVDEPHLRWWLDL